MSLFHPHHLALPLLLSVGSLNPKKKKKYWPGLFPVKIESLEITRYIPSAVHVW